MHRLILAATAAACVSGAALASQQGVLVTTNWRLSDRCAKVAQAAFPDFTAEANAKRDAKLAECLAASNLPPRQPEAPRQ